MGQSETTASFGYWVRRKRMALDMTQSDLARKVGCARITISKIERDERRPSRQMATLIAEGLSIPPNEQEQFILIALGERFVGNVPLADQPETNVSVSQAETIPCNLPVPSTPFIGRTTELAQLVQRLKNPDCRLLTLAGPGGFGKTRLAIRLGELACSMPQRFPDGVFFVALDGLERPELVIPSIAAAIGFTFYEQLAQENQVLTYLSAKELLLILDNAEEVLDPELVDRISAHAPNVLVLITSREALNLQQEWFQPVGGMNTGLGDHDDTTESTIADAEALFEECAQRVRPGFSLATEKRHVRAICRMVDGVPLAIELAAAWLKALPIARIEEELGDSIDFLSARALNIPLRHRSMRAVLDQTWRYLTEEEKRVYRRLSVFVGGFQGDAARAVADATPQILWTLVDKSLLYYDQSGRYRIHTLLRKLGTEKLEIEESEFTEISAQHSDYYLTFLRERTESIVSSQQRTILSELAMELDNVNRAWRNAIQRHEFNMLIDGSPCLTRFLWIRGRYEEGEQLLLELLEEMKTQQLSPALQHARLAVQIRMTQFIAASGDTNRAADGLRAVQPILETEEPSAEKALYHYSAGLISTYEMQSDADRELAAAYDGFQSIGDEAAVAEVALRLEHALRTTDLARCRKLADESLAIYRSLGDPTGIADALDAVGTLQCAFGNYEDGEQAYKESLALAKDVGNRWIEARAIGGLAYVAHGNEQWDTAVTLATERLNKMKELGYEFEVNSSQATLAIFYLDTGNYQEVLDIFDTSALLQTWVWATPALVQAQIATGHYADAMNSLSDFAIEMRREHISSLYVDHLTAWAMLLTSDCSLIQANENMPRQLRNEVALELLTIASNYDPGRSFGHSRSRATRILSELSDKVVSGTKYPSQARPIRTPKEISDDLLNIRLG